MKRTVLAAFVVVLGLAALALSLPYLVSADRIKQQIEARVLSVTGKTIGFSGSPRITFNPFLGMEVTNVVLRDPQSIATDPPMLQMEKLRGRILFFPALLGRIEIGDYQFVRPRFNLRNTPTSGQNWISPSGDLTLIIETAKTRRETNVLPGSPGLPSLPALQLGKFEIVDGTVYYENRATSRRETFTNINGMFAWPDSNSAFNFQGDCIWRDEAFEFRLSSGDPLLLLSGGTTALDARIVSDAFIFEFSGNGNLISNLHLTGEGRMEAASLIRFARLFGAPLSPVSAFADFSISGKLETTPQKLVFSDATVEMDGNTGRGNLQLSFGKTSLPQIDGTISAIQLVLTRYAEAFTIADQPALTATPAPVSLLDINLDLRLSAQSVQMGNTKVKDVAATLSTRNSEALLEVGNSTLAGGVLTGKMSLGKKELAWVLGMDARLDGFDLAEASSRYASGGFHFSGQGNATLRGQSTGDDISSAFGNMEGEFAATAQNGTLSGIDFQQLLMLAQDPGGTGLQSSLAGETAFRELKANVLLNRDFATVGSMQIANSKVLADIHGRANFGDGGIALQIQLAPGPSVLPGPSAPLPVRLFAGGSYAAPLLTRIQTNPDQR